MTKREGKTQNNRTPARFDGMRHAGRHAAAGGPYLPQTKQTRAGGWDNNNGATSQHVAHAPTLNPRQRQRRHYRKRNKIQCRSMVRGTPMQSKLTPSGLLYPNHSINADGVRRSIGERATSSLAPLTRPQSRSKLARISSAAGAEDAPQTLARCALKP